MNLYGANVVILSSNHYANKFAGKTGIVRRQHENRVGIEIKGFTNSASKTGVFWFETSNVVIIPDERVKRVTFNQPKTIVLWADGTKTIVSCKEGEIFDCYTGFCVATAKKMFGSVSKIKKIISSYNK